MHHRVRPTKQKNLRPTQWLVAAGLGIIASSLSTPVSAQTRSNAQTAPALAGGAAATGEDAGKEYRLVIVRHVYVGGIAQLFANSEIISSEDFLIPEGAMSGGMMGGGMGGGMMGGGMMGGMGGMGGGMMGGGMGGFGGGGMGGFGGGGGGFGGGGFGGGGFGAGGLGGAVGNGIGF